MILKRVIFSSILSTVALCTNVLCMNNSAHDELTSGNNLPRPFAEKCTESISTVVREEDPKLFRELAPTLALMKMLLRENFKPLPEGLRDNVVEFFSSPEFTPHNCMGDQEIILDDNLTNILCRLILLEQKESLNGNVVLWHGLPGEALFTYKYYAYLFSRLTGQDVGSFILRGDHFYAKNPKTGEIFKTLHEVREAYGIQKIIALSVGPNVSRSTASSVGFFCNSFCGGEFSIFDVVCSTLLFQGMSLIEAKRSAKQVEGLFKKIFLVDHEKNGGILGISLPRNVVDDLALHVQMGGREYDPFVRMVIKGIKAIFGKKSLERHIIESSLSAIYSHKKGASVDEIISEIEKIFWTSLPEEKSHELKKLLESYLSSRSQKDSSITNLLENIQMALSQNLTNDEICDLTNEIALYLNPEIRQKVFGTFRHPLNPEQEALFDAELRALVDSHVALIAASKTKPFENAFLIKRSKEMEESADARYQIEAVPFLIERNLITEAQKAIKQYPNFEQNEEIIRLLVGRTLFSFRRGFNEVLETVEKIFGKAIFSFIHPDHLPLILRGYADSRYFIEFFNYLIKHDINFLLDYWHRSFIQKTV